MNSVNDSDDNNDKVIVSSNVLNTYDQRTAHMWDYDIVQLHMEQGIVRCHHIVAAQAICVDFRRNVVTYSESDFLVNVFLAVTLFLLARHVVGVEIMMSVLPLLTILISSSDRD